MREACAGTRTTDLELARRIVEAGWKLAGAGLNEGSAGNISARCGCGKALLITPTGRDWRLLRERELVAIDIATGVATSAGRPSSEWRLHVEVYRWRPDVEAVVHHHGPWASIVAVARQTIPVLMDEAAEIGEIPTASYAPSGSAELADAAARELAAGRAAVLLANHGAVTVGRSLGEAVRRAFEVERLARIFIGAQVLGGAHALTETEVAVNRRFFHEYSRDDRVAPGATVFPPTIPRPVRLSDLWEFSFRAGVTLATLFWALVSQRWER